MREHLDGACPPPLLRRRQPLPASLPTASDAGVSCFVPVGLGLVGLGLGSVAKKPPPPFRGKGVCSSKQADGHLNPSRKVPFGGQGWTGRSVVGGGEAGSFVVGGGSIPCPPLHDGEGHQLQASQNRTSSQPFLKKI